MLGKRVFVSNIRLNTHGKRKKKTNGMVEYHTVGFIIVKRSNWYDIRVS